MNANNVIGIIGIVFGIIIMAVIIVDIITSDNGGME